MSSAHLSNDDLNRFRDRALATGRASEVEGHLRDCEVCRSRLADAEALSRLLNDGLARSARELPANFAARVMSQLPVRKARLSPLEALLGWARERRQALALGLLGAAAAASLILVFAPSLRNREGLPEETAENEAQIHSIEVSSPDRSAVVFESAEGNTVIWVMRTDDDGGQAAPTEE